MCSRRACRSRSICAVLSLAISVSIANAAPTTLQYATPSERSFLETINTAKPSEKAILEPAAQDTFPVFIFLPGILGSKLSKMKNGKETIFWGKFSLADFVSDNPDFAYNKNEPVLASPLDTFYALRKDIDVYGNAFAQLKAITGIPKNVLLFSYDWRQSNIASASDFSKWLCKPEVSSIIQNHPVIFIAHSMGGLVLKYWLKHFYKSPGCNSAALFSSWLKINRVVLVGTPNFGAPKAVLQFAKGTTLYVDPTNDRSIWKALVETIDMDTVSRNLNKYGIRFPSAYQLLPIVNNKCFPRPGWETAVEYRTKTGIPGNLNLFDADWWRELGWPVQLKDNNERDQFLKNELPQLLAEAEKFLCDVSDYNLASKFKVVHIYGFKQDTVCRIIFDEKNRSGSTLPPVIEPLCKGDGTVPEWIASDKHRPGLIRNFDGELHAQLVAATEFGLYLEDLRNELVDEFSKKGPISKRRRGCGYELICEAEVSSAFHAKCCRCGPKIKPSS